MRTLVLGGCGFIGSHVAESLFAAGHQVSVFARPNADRRNLESLQESVEFIAGDFLNAEDIRRAVSDAEVVIHLVGSTLPGSSLDNPVFDIQTNVVASVSLFKACVEAKVKKVVYVSSGGTVYGVPKADLINEGHTLDPINPYGLSKLSVEKYLGIYSYQYGIDHTVLRLSNPYGSRQRPGSGQGVIASWMDCIRHGRAIEIWGDGSTVRDYLTVGDAASAIVLAAESTSCSSILNVGSGQGHTLSQVLGLVEDAAGQPARIVRRDVRKVDVPRNVLDVTLIRKELEWVAKTSLAQGVEEMWQEGAR